MTSNTNPNISGDTLRNDGLDNQDLTLHLENPEIVQIRPVLFLGNVKSSTDPQTLYQHNITAIVSPLIGPYARWEHPAIRQIVPGARHLFVPARDSNTTDLLTRLPAICDWIDTQIHHWPTRSSTLPSPATQGIAGPSHGQSYRRSTSIPARGKPAEQNVLVHCYNGTSRSATVVIAYLMRKDGRGLDWMQEFVECSRSIYPNASFLDQLRVWEQTKYQLFWLMPNPSAPLQPYYQPKDEYADFLARREKKLYQLQQKGGQSSRGVAGGQYGVGGYASSRCSCVYLPGDYGY
ncbi:protein-tyrosine phosphatase-like protein [Cercophora scortea]|uniref:protein-tyrosine-phosphatase n=1 Tax=Cercophora scortea TaxID=314031 RepID=A0AAE0IFH2_9PEZI|nr:protein-tyrosine phosphatase-like protein [Cercophora scortea]